MLLALQVADVLGFVSKGSWRDQREERLHRAGKPNQWMLLYHSQAEGDQCGACRFDEAVREEAVYISEGSR